MELANDRASLDGTTEKTKNSKTKTEDRSAHRKNPTDVCEDTEHAQQRWVRIKPAFGGAWQLLSGKILAQRRPVY